MQVQNNQNNSRDSPLCICKLATSCGYKNLYVALLSHFTGTVRFKPHEQLFDTLRFKLHENIVCATSGSNSEFLVRG